MTRFDEMAKQFKESIIGRLGPEAEVTIFNGKTAPSDPSKRAQWVKEALINLDKPTDKKICNEIMHGNGVNCANHNVSVVKKTSSRDEQSTRVWKSS